MIEFEEDHIRHIIKMKVRDLTIGVLYLDGVWKEGMNVVPSQNEQKQIKEKLEELNG